MYAYTMKHPIYLEDYIVYLHNLSDISVPGITVENMIRLSRFDRAPIRNLALQVKVRRLGFTAKQVDLARLLVTKYRKQLSKWNVTIDNLDSVPLLFQIREVEQIKHVIQASDGYLHLAFNFNQELINELEANKGKQGKFSWSKESHSWVIYPSEHNLDFVMCFAKKHNFAIGAEVCELHSKLEKFKSQTTEEMFAPILQADCTFKNVATELTDHLAEKDITGLIKLCDRSWLYNYKLPLNTTRELYRLLQNYPDPGMLFSLMISRTVKMHRDNYIDTAKTYCQLTGKGPVIVITDPWPRATITLDEGIAVDSEHVYHYTCNSGGGMFGVSLPIIPTENALIITDNSNLDWHLLFNTTNNIWYINKEASANKDTN